MLAVLALLAQISAGDIEHLRDLSSTDLQVARQYYRELSAKMEPDVNDGNYRIHRLGFFVAIQLTDTELINQLITELAQPKWHSIVSKHGFAMTTNMAISYRRHDQYGAALSAYQCAERYIDSAEQRGKNALNLAVLYRLERQFDNSWKALETIDKERLPNRGKAILQANYAAWHYSQQRFAEAADFYRQAYTSFTKINESEGGITTALNWLESLILARQFDAYQRFHPSIAELIATSTSPLYKGHLLWLDAVVKVQVDKQPLSQQQVDELLREMPIFTEWDMLESFQHLANFMQNTQINNAIAKELLNAHTRREQRQQVKINDALLKQFCQN